MRSLCARKSSCLLTLGPYSCYCKLKWGIWVPKIRPMEAASADIIDFKKHSANKKGILLTVWCPVFYPGHFCVSFLFHAAESPWLSLSSRCVESAPWAEFRTQEFALSHQTGSNMDLWAITCAQSKIVPWKAIGKNPIWWCVHEQGAGDRSQELHLDPPSGCSRFTMPWALPCCCNFASWKPHFLACWDRAFLFFFFSL